MDKASRAIRRSGAKLLSGGNSDLNVMISELKDLRTNAKTFITTQDSASQDMKRWAANEENRALQDVAYHIAELNLQWTEVQREFTDHLREYRNMFELVLEGEKQVAQAKIDHSTCEQKEEKLKKDLRKANKVKNSRVTSLLCGTSRREATEEAFTIEGKLQQIQGERTAALNDVTQMIRENEAVKMIRLKEGFVRMAEAYIEMGKKCATIFQAQKKVALEIPDVHGHELEEIKYSGTVNTQSYVQQAKDKIKKYRRESYRLEPPKVHFITVNLDDRSKDPPPPYTSQDNYHDTSSDSFTETKDSSQHRLSDADTLHSTRSPGYSSSSPGYHVNSPYYSVNSPGNSATTNGYSNNSHQYHGNSPRHTCNGKSPSYHSSPAGTNFPNPHTTSPGYAPENHSMISHCAPPGYTPVLGSQSTGTSSGYIPVTGSQCTGTSPGYTPEPAFPGYKSIYPTLPTDDTHLYNGVASLKIS